MSFGVYVHIPYCLQRCTYCDFATYSISSTNNKTPLLPPDQYFALIQSEIQQKARFLPPRHLDTVYFGGGTPSLVSADYIVAVLDWLTREGFTRDTKTEITLEINPATVDAHKMKLYLQAGVNRFSVGAQTFNNSLLKSVHREHDSQQTLDTVKLLQKHNVSFSLDLLFALPGQTLEILHDDLQQMLALKPGHISPYCLTVPEGHVLSKQRLQEDDQIAMFALIQQQLRQAGFHRYEISNFCQPGHESKHNSLYWSDQEYWGIGLSAHSYLKNQAEQSFGMRFWNASTMGLYEQHVQAHTHQTMPSIICNLPNSQYECLQLHQAVTDFCHTSLRRAQGLSLAAVKEKFGLRISQTLLGPLLQLTAENYLQTNINTDNFSLTEEGVLLSNQVFAQLTFLKDELPFK